MKKLFMLFGFAVTASLAFGQKKVSIDSLSGHLNEKVIVCSEVYGVKELEKMTFINVGAAYPKSPLTIVIFAKDLPNFKTTPSALYGNKKICVTGELKDFKGKMEIIVSKPEEITVE